MTTIGSRPSAPPLHERGTPGYRRVGAALWCAGLATFVLVYSVQGLLPTLAAEFGVSSSASSLVLSATTGTLALAIVPLSAVAESWGRVRVMTAALALSAVLGLLAPLAPSFGALVAIRALQGVALAALPALAMAHVTREVAPRWLGGAMGLLIAGNTLGGLSGRLIAGVVADLGGWRVALAVVGAVSLAATVAFRLLLPPSVAPAAPRVRLRDLGGPLRVQLRDPGLRCLFGIAFLLMGAFVTVYNYLGFRLIAPPFSLPPALVGLVFLGYLAGSYASTAAGRLGDRVGRRRVLWAAVLVALAGAWITRARRPAGGAGRAAARHRGVLRRALVGQQLGRAPLVVAARRRSGRRVVAVPAGLLRGQQHRRLGRRPGLRRRRLARAGRLRQRAAARGRCAGPGAAPDPRGLNVDQPSVAPKRSPRP